MKDRARHLGIQNLELLAEESEARELRQGAMDYPCQILTHRQMCDLELLMNGAFSPLSGFLNKKDYEECLKNLRLADGSVWPIPITLDVSEAVAKKISKGSRLALRSPEWVLLAVLFVEDVWMPDKKMEAEAVYGTTNKEHPGVSYLMDQALPTYVGGRIIGVERPTHYDFLELRKTPSDLRNTFKKQNISRVVAFQTRNPMHKAHFEMTLRAAKQAEAHLLLHPVVGMTKPGDVDYFTRIRCYEKVYSHYPKGSASISLLPLAMRMAGPREAVWHAIIRKNFGCTHFIVGRDHAGPGKDSSGKAFYGPYDAQELLAKYQSEIGISMIPMKEMHYIASTRTYAPEDEIAKGTKTLSISGTELRERLSDDKEIPEWFTFPEILDELRTAFPPKIRQGFTVFFTGLSGSGKSTIANALCVKLMELTRRKVTILDGDVVRSNLSSELGFSKEHRSLNIRRIGYVASEITKYGGITICAPIAPYQADRDYNRRTISQLGGYLEVFVSTPIAVCEARDRKGLYASARQGKIRGFTGVDDPYEIPEKPEVTIDTSDVDVSNAVQNIVQYLRSKGYLKASVIAREVQ